MEQINGNDKMQDNNDNKIEEELDEDDPLDAYMKEL